MSKSIIGRLEAQERARARPLPVYRITLADDTYIYLNALGAHIYITQLDAGTPGIQEITDVQWMQGVKFPHGSIWESFERDLLAHIRR